MSESDLRDEISHLKKEVEELTMAYNYMKTMFMATEEGRSLQDEVDRKGVVSNGQE